MSREPPDLTHEQMIELIELYKCNPCLWDAQHIHYRNTVWRNQIREKIGKVFNMSVLEVRRKIINLRGQWVKEYRKCNADENYTSNWIYYNELKFLEGQTQIYSADTTTINESPSAQYRDRVAKRKINYDPSWQDELTEVQYNDVEEEITIKTCRVKMERSQDTENVYNDYEKQVKSNEIEKYLSRSNDSEKRKLDMRYITSELEGLSDDDYYDVHYDILTRVIAIKKKKRLCR